MNGFKRRRSNSPATSPTDAHDESVPPVASKSDVDSEPTEPDTTEPNAKSTVEYRLPTHMQRTLIALTSELQAALKRIEALETSFVQLHDHAVNGPSHGDVLEVRMHGAKLAAELARTTVELRGEIGIATDAARRAARAAEAAASEAENAAASTNDSGPSLADTIRHLNNPFSATA
jgi:hypothetical protein